MSTHTPGPWAVHRFSDGSASVVSSNAWSSNPAALDVCDGQTIKVYGKQHQADAQLIAAAPELLAALQAMVKNFRPYSESCGDDEVIDLALTAIAKAMQP